jgi:hypothetical protein
VANVFLKAEQIVATGLGMLQRELVLTRLINRLAQVDFRGAKNDTVNLRVPSILTAREYAWRNDRSSPIVLDELEELSIPVSLNHDVYSAVAVTDEQLTLDIVDFADQVLSPQVRAVAERIETIVADVMLAAPVKSTLDYDDYADGIAVLVEARRLLNIANVPVAGRVVVLGANLEADFLNEEKLQRVDASGNDDALRDAVIGRIAGFTVIGNVNGISPWAGYAFHPSAFGYANVAPAIPAGAPFGAAQSYQGLAMRWIRDYDTMYLRDRSVVSSFAGAASINDERDAAGDLTGKNVRAVKIEMGVS